MSKTEIRNEVLNINFSQKGIADFPGHAIFATFFIKDDGYDAHEQWLELAKKTDALCRKTNFDTVCILGVDFTLWRKWCEADGKNIPTGFGSPDKLERAPFSHTGGQFWFHIKAGSEDACHRIFDLIVHELEPITRKFINTAAEKRHGGKVFGGRFTDAMINPVDPVNLSERVIVGEEDIYYRGSAYVIQQKFKHNWHRLDNMNAIEMENMVGRNHDDSIIPMPGNRSHISCVRKLDGERVTHRILRQALPYGHSNTGNGKEEGVYFVAYARETNVYDSLIDGIQGTEKGFVKDQMLGNTQSESGNFWFVPSAKEAGLVGAEGEVNVPMNPYFDVRSPNGLMYYNNRDFLHQIREKSSDLEISDRIAILIAQTFSAWNDTWKKKVFVPPLGHLKEHLQKLGWKKYQWVLEGSTALRKGLAIKISLSDVLLQNQFRENAGLYTIKPREIIVGNLPPFTLGSGTRVMEYLDEDEKIQFFFGNLNEYSASGHNVPNYPKALRLGIKGLIDEATGKLAGARDNQKDFYQSVIWALEGVRDFVLAYSKLANEMVIELPESSVMERKNLIEIEGRMKKLATQKPDGVLESLQLIFILNCALHQSGEEMSIGRLDQYLVEAYEQDIKNKRLQKSDVQEIIDSFWLKMDETVLYNRQHMEDYLTYGSGAVFYSAGNFPQGSALNQWVQQVTVGGYLANNNKNPEDGCNDITLMCLRAARRLPLNAPCLSLRVHKNMNQPIHEDIFNEAAKAILSGGAHPIIINDDKLCVGLHESGPLSLADSRDYVCDGCYEPVIGGKTEWAFSYVPILPAVGMAMNQGTTIEGAGWVHLRGLKTSWNSPPPQDIESFEAFLDIFYTQYKWQISAFYNTLMNSYGSLAAVCPSPLFSSLVDGCMESGRDMTNGGAELHIVAPMMCGITNAIDSLYAIKKLVFDPDTSSTTLPELLQALWNNWGEDMKEPFHNGLAGPGRADDVARLYKDLRAQALALPKFGRGQSEDVRNLGDNVVEKCVKIIRDGIDHPLPGIDDAYQVLKKKYAIDGREFAFTVTPGIGTFEDNLGLGEGMAASADGRLAGSAIANDFSSSPSPSDQPPMTEPFDIHTALNDWNTHSIGVGLSNAAPTDINIREDFPVAELEKVLKKFATSETGSNLLTITTGDPESYEQAVIFPEKYDLLRVRQGGWSEFYMAMFPAHQEFIIRRPYYAPGKT